MVYTCGYIMAEMKTRTKLTPSAARGAHDYRELDLITIPEDVPELGVRAGDLGTIAGVYDAGRLLGVEIGRDDGTSAGFVDVLIEEGGALHVVGFSPLSD